MKTEHNPEDINKEEQEQLKNAAPVLHSMEKGNPFSVPAGYFDQLPSEIQEKISSRKVIPWYVVIIKSLYKPQLAMILLVLVVLVSGTIYFLNRQGQYETTEEFAGNADDLKNAEIASTIDESTLMDELANLQDEGEIYKSNEVEIENYLIDNQTDLNQLINEL